MHFEIRGTKAPFLYVFAEPVTEERADEIQSTGEAYARDWARRVVGVGKGKGDPEVQEAWQELQDEVNEQVSEDGTASKSTATTAEDVATVEETTESAQEDAETSEDAENDTPPVEAPKSAKDTTSSGPLMGWTLTVRNKVNGHYLTRPEKLEPEDDWQIEYHINDIEEDSAWDLYNSLKERRRQLVGLSDEEVDKSLSSYRQMIQRYANRGRTWRAEQDQLNDERGVQLFKPLGPGSAVSESTKE